MVPDVLSYRDVYAAKMTQEAELPPEQIEPVDLSFKAKRFHSSEEPISMTAILFTSEALKKENGRFLNLRNSKEEEGKTKEVKPNKEFLEKASYLEGINKELSSESELRTKNISENIKRGNLWNFYAFPESEKLKIQESLTSSGKSNDSNSVLPTYSTPSDLERRHLHISSGHNSFPLPLCSKLPFNDFYIPLPASIFSSLSPENSLSPNGSYEEFLNDNKRVFIAKKHSKDSSFKVNDSENDEITPKSSPANCIVGSSSVDRLADFTRAIATISPEINISVVQPKNKESHLFGLSKALPPGSQNLSLTEPNNLSVKSLPFYLSSSTSRSNNNVLTAEPSKPESQLILAAEAFNAQLANNPHLASTLLSSNIDRRSLLDSLRKKCYSSALQQPSSADIKFWSVQPNSCEETQVTQSSHTLQTFGDPSAAKKTPHSNPSFLTHGLDLSFTAGSIPNNSFMLPLQQIQDVAK